MSLFKKHINKNNFKSVDNITSNPKFYLSENETNDTLCDAYIELDAPFKMIKISHIGYANPIQPDYDGISITSTEGNVYIRNNSKTMLNDNFLFSFGGTIKDVSRVVVYGWGQNSIFADISGTESMMPLSMDFDENIVSSNAILMEHKEYTETTNDAIVNMDRKPDLEIKNNIIKGLYTNGSSFIFNRKRYKGYYHYNKDEKTYKTGREPNPKEVPLRKIKRLRKELKRIRRRNGL